MKVCDRCGEQLSPGAEKCPTCGYPVSGQSGPTAMAALPRQERQERQEREAGREQPFTDYEVFDGENEQVRRMSALSYVGPLFFVPLLLKKDSEYIRFHFNQGLSLFIFELISFGLLHGLMGVAAKVACIYLAVLGVKNAAAGIKEKLPLVGNWNLVKFKK